VEEPCYTKGRAFELDMLNREKKMHLKLYANYYPHFQSYDYKSSDDYNFAEYNGRRKRCCKLKRYPKIDYFKFRFRNKNYSRDSTLKQMSTMIESPVEELLLYFNSEKYHKDNNVLFTMFTLLSRAPLDRISIYGGKLNSKQLWRIFSSFRRAKDILISGCELLTEEPKDLGSAFESTNTKRIFIIDCGNKDLSNWEDNPERFENIFKSLKSQKDLHKSLKIISLTDGILQDEFKKEVVKANGFGHVCLYCFNRTSE
jgi:hypothetical protein